MSQPAAIGRLTSLGLTSYEAKAYLALIRRDSSTAAEVSRLSGLPRQRVYDVLTSLVDKGLATTRPGSPVKYSAAAPDVAVQRLLAHHRNELSRLEEAATTTVGELTPAYREGLRFTDPLEYIEVLRDAAAISERFNELQGAVQREILIFTRPPYAIPPQENVEGLKLLRERTARSVYEYSLFDDPGHVEAVRQFVRAGEQARFVESLPLKLAIFDERIVVFGLEDPHGGSSALTLAVVEHPALAQILRIAFMSVWESGTTFEQAEELLGRAPSAA